MLNNFGILFCIAIIPLESKGTLLNIMGTSQEEKYRLDAEVVLVLGKTVSCFTDKEIPRNGVKDLG